MMNFCAFVPFNKAHLVYESMGRLHSGVASMLISLLHSAEYVIKCVFFMNTVLSFAYRACVSMWPSG